jgi:DNA-binding NarL/FixJ family response regulator
LLLVDDRVQDRQLWARHIRHAVTFVACTTGSDARRVVAERDDIHGLLIDVILEDCCGVDLLEQLRYSLPVAPCIVTSAVSNPAVIRRARELGAEFVEKPIACDRFDAFLNLVIAGAEPLEAVARAIHEVARRWMLKPHETAVVAAMVGSRTREDAARALDTSVNTLKSRIKTLLAKTGHHDIHEVVHTVLGIARQRGGGDTASPIELGSNIRRPR